MRSNCIKHCIQQKFDDCKKLIGNDIKECLYERGTLWTMDDFYHSQNVKPCQYDNDYCYAGIFKFKSKCQSNCDMKCVNRYYNYEVKTSINYEKIQNFTYIYINHNQMPDQITEHIPEMTFIQFASNFGGLLGMWMGLSFLAILKFSLKVL